MTHELNIYTKTKPAFDGFFMEDLGFQTFKQTPHLHVCRWRPVLPNGHQAQGTVTAVAYASPAYYSTRQAPSGTRQSALEEAREHGIADPAQALARIVTKKGAIVARPKLYKMLRRLPALETLLPEHDPLLGILDFSEGRKLYRVKFEAPEGVYFLVRSAMYNLGTYTAKRFDGALWDVPNARWLFPEYLTRLPRDLAGLEDLLSEGAQEREGDDS